MITYIIIGLILLLFAVGGYYVITKKPTVVTELKQCKQDAEYLDRNINKCINYSQATLDLYESAKQNKCKTRVVLDPYSDNFYYLNVPNGTVCDGEFKCRIYNCINGDCTDIGPKICPEGYNCREDQNGDCVFGACPSGKYKNSDGQCVSYSQATIEKYNTNKNNQCILNVEYLLDQDDVKITPKDSGVECTLTDKCKLDPVCDGNGGCFGRDKICGLGYQCNSINGDCEFKSCPALHYNDTSDPNNKACKPYSDETKAEYSSKLNNSCYKNVRYDPNVDRVLSDFNDGVQGSCAIGYKCESGQCTFKECPFDQTRKMYNLNGVCTDYSSTTVKKYNDNINNQCVSGITWNSNDDDVTINYKTKGTPCTLTDKCKRNPTCDGVGGCDSTDFVKCKLGYSCDSSNGECKLINGKCPDLHWNDVANKECKPYSDATKALYQKAMSNTNGSGNDCFYNIDYNTNADSVISSIYTNQQRKCGLGYVCNGNGDCEFKSCPDGTVHDVSAKTCVSCGFNAAANFEKTECLPYPPLTPDDLSNFESKCPLNTYWVGLATNGSYQCRRRTRFIPTTEQGKEYGCRINYVYKRNEDNYIYSSLPEGSSCNTSNPCITNKCNANAECKTVSTISNGYPSNGVCVQCNAANFEVVNNTNNGCYECSVFDLLSVDDGTTDYYGDKCNVYSMKDLSDKFMRSS